MASSMANLKSRLLVLVLVRDVLEGARDELDGGVAVAVAVGEGEGEGLRPLGLVDVLAGP